MTVNSKLHVMNSSQSLWLFMLPSPNVMNLHEYLHIKVSKLQGKMIKWNSTLPFKYGC